MTDKETIVGLKCCCPTTTRCSKCPYDGIDCCIKSCMGDAIDLIHRQQEEIERLQKILGETSRVLSETCAGVRAEAIKEFAERLITTFNDMEYQAKTTRKTVKVEELRDQMHWILHTVVVETINNAKQEMVGDNT